MRAMNEHETTRVRIPAAVAGTLPSPEAEALRAHIAVCEKCHREMERWERLAGAVGQTEEAALVPARLSRIAALARARREAVIEERRQGLLLGGLAAIGWVLIFASVPVWRALGEMIHRWTGWPAELGLPGAFLLSGLLSWAVVVGLIPLLRNQNLAARDGTS